MRTPTFQHMPSSTPFWAVVAIATAFVVAGLVSAHHMESAGHWVTGMNNRVVWGVPHVFAVFLIVSASGALNAASIASVFGRETYKPLSRLSALMAITLLVGGLTVLVLDLGRPDRLIVAMTHYNFRSIFAWNIFLYTGFIVLVVVYLWMMFEPRMNRFVGRVGTTAFAWRLMLTTGTGSIFAFLAAREAFDSAVLAPMFIAMSLSFGTALTLILSALIFSIRGDGLPTEATGGSLMVYASGVDEAEAVRETVAVLKKADLAPLDVTGYGSLHERLNDGHDISKSERDLMQRALNENSVIVAQMTPFFETDPRSMQ